MDVRRNKAFIILSTLVGIVEAKDYYAAPNSNVTLECPFSRGFSPNDSSLTWNGPQYTDVLSRDNQLDPKLPLNVSERLTIVPGNTSGQYNLHVSRVSTGDNGSYSCKIVKNLLFYIDTSLLYFLEAPSDVYVHDSNNTIQGIEGKDLTITCTALGGKPPPEVTLRSDDTNYAVGNQTVNYVFKVIDRSFDLGRLICQANSSVLNRPLLRQYLIYLQLKPLTPKFQASTDPIEGQSFLNISCTSNGSRPAAFLSWKTGKADVTNFSTYTISRDEEKDTFTVTSVLVYKVNRTNNGQKVTCEANNTVGLAANNVTINVKYPPDVFVNNLTRTQNESSFMLVCNATGNPTTYTFYQWQHWSHYGTMIRRLDGYSNGTLALPKEMSYQDSGRYICTVSNGIVDTKGNISQTGSGYVAISDKPVFTSDNRITLGGQIRKSVNIAFNIYSIPKYENTWQFFKGNKTIQNSSDYSHSESPTIVRDTIYGTVVELDGYVITLMINYLKDTDFTTYKLLLKNKFGSAEHSINLESASAPDIPGNFSVILATMSSLTIQWDPGYDGGNEQSFCVEFRKPLDQNWTTCKKNISLSSDVRSRQTYEVTNLLAGTLYELRMFAVNKFNMSHATNSVQMSTLSTLDNQASPLGPIIGGVAGALAAVLIIIVIIWFLIFKRKQDSSTHSKAARSRSDSEVPDGLQHNILYQSAGSDFKPLVPKAEAGKKNQKPSTSETEYAEVQKPNAVYAEANKTVQQKNLQDKKQKDMTDKKKRPRKPGKKVNKGNNNQDGEYANAGMSLKDMVEGEYGNAEDKSGPPTSRKNLQGLEYADLSFTKQIPQKGNKPVIHGEEDRTLYSEVDHSKKAPPPPQESAYEETNFKHG